MTTKNVRKEHEAAGILRSTPVDSFSISLELRLLPVESDDSMHFTRFPFDLHSLQTSASDLN